MKNSEELINNISKKAFETLNRYLDTHKKPNYSSAKGYIASELNAHIYELTERRPIIIPILMEI